MINRKSFFDIVRRDLFDGKLTNAQVNGIDAILNEWELNHADGNPKHLAYMLATAHHETGRTMQPIEEWGKGKGLPYGKMIRMDRKPYWKPKQLYYGRGFVQLTWFENYEKAGAKLKVDLLGNPALALDLGVATKIMFAGMFEGWFTGKKLADYITPLKTDFVNARKIINGLDKADQIAGYANLYASALANS